MAWGQGCREGRGEGCPLACPSRGSAGLPCLWTIRFYIFPCLLSSWVGLTWDEEIGPGVLRGEARLASVATASAEAQALGSQWPSTNSPRAELLEPQLLGVLSGVSPALPAAIPF